MIARCTIISYFKLNYRGIVIKAAWKWYKMYSLIDGKELRNHIQAHTPIAHHSWQSGQQYTLEKINSIFSSGIGQTGWPHVQK